MILNGQFDAPFVRRVAATLELYGLAYERAPLSVFGDFEACRPSPARLTSRTEPGRRPRAT